MLPPISRTVSTKPLLVGFISTPSMVMSEPSVINPAAMRKAAELGSPGTAIAVP